NIAQDTASRPGEIWLFSLQISLEGYRARERAPSGGVPNPGRFGPEGKGGNMATAKKRKKSEPEAETPKAAPRPKIPGLSARPVWQGMLRLSLVSCPVALYKATSRANDISFNLLNPKTNNRIRMVPTDPETGPVDRADLVRGYEVEKNRYVIIEDEELDA